MILIYVCNDDSLPAKHIARCKINPSTGVINYRTDLEFYVPLPRARSRRFATSSSSTATSRATTCGKQSSRSAG
jgi:hypothetical protein